MPKGLRAILTLSLDLPMNFLYHSTMKQNLTLISSVWWLP